MTGLTATRANIIDAFLFFGCDANVPTFLYDYRQSVKGDFLVDFSLYQAHQDSSVRASRAWTSARGSGTPSSRRSPYAKCRSPARVWRGHEKNGRSGHHLLLRVPKW